MAQATVSELHIYPVKSLQGIELESAEVTEQGLYQCGYYQFCTSCGA